MWWSLSCAVAGAPGAAAQAGLGAALGALVVGVVVGIVAAIGGPRRRPRRPIEPSVGRVRLSSRSFERVALAALGLVVALVVAISTDIVVLAAAWVALAALIAAARRGAFEPLRNREDDAPVDDGYVASRADPTVEAIDG